MAARPEDYRLKELLTKGSKAIDKTRDKKTGGILVRKKDGKQVKPFVKEKKAVPFGSKPIKRKQISPRYKSDWVDSDEFDEVEVEEQTSFSGETSGYLEKPKYNEDELVKAVDVEVDELIKKQKQQKGPYILKSKYDKLQNNFDEKVSDLEDLREQLNDQIALTEEKISQIATLEISLDSAELQRAASENETQVANERYSGLLDNFQQSVIKGTKEGIERVSLTAQVRGLQAQKSTLKQLLDAQKDLVKTLQQQAENLAQQQEKAAENKEAAQGADVSGEGGVKVVNRTSDDFDFRFQSLAKSNGWDKNGTKLEIINLDEEKEVNWSISAKYKKGGHGSPWIGFTKTSGTLPKRNGSTPGTEQLDVKKIRNVNSPKGRKKTFEDEITVTVGQKSFKLKALFYRKRRKGGSGN
jgi:hypothetical protein